MKKYYFLRYILYILIISSVSVYLILLTYGYKINWDNFKLQKTSIIYIASIPQDVNVYLNNKFIANITPIKYTNAFPGIYEIILRHPLYEDWKKTFFVKHDYVSQDPDVVMILKDKKEIELTDKEIENYKLYFQDKNKQTEDKSGIKIKNNSEIYFEDVFITRFSKNIKNIIWFNDKKHFIYQIDDEIFFCDSDGTNNILLIKLPGNEIADFVSDEGKYLIYQYNNEIKKIQITNIESLLKEKYFNKAVKIIK